MNNTQKEQHKKFLYSLILSILSLSLLVLKCLSYYFDRKRETTHRDIVFAKTRLGRTTLSTLLYKVD